VRISGRGGGRALVVPAVAAVLAGLFVSVAPTPSAQAQETLIESDPAVVKARAELEAAQQAAHEAAGRVEATVEQRDVVQGKIADDQSRIAAADKQRTDLSFFRDVLLEQVRARARALYTSGGDGTGAASLLADNALDGVRRQQLGDAAARSNRATVKKLQIAQSQLADLRASLDRDRADLQTQQDSLDALVTRLQSEQATVDQTVAAANAALARARVIGALHAAGEPIMGPAALTADQMVAWFDTQGYHPHLPDTTVAELAQIFIEEGADENVRGDFAFAQAIVETGGFASSPDDNYSGLGWCDSCSRGTVFPTPRDGVRAQIQLLLNYADPDSRAANLHHPPSPYWWSADPAVAARDFDNYFAKGWAPTWSDMGHGNWATDPSYAGKVISVYHHMVAFTQGS
jgi:Mannosyl-glycoprotein endo-beta-N-acetylglucosaminidase